MIDRLMEEHPVLVFVIAFVVIVAVIWIKMCIDEKKGVNSEEKQKIHKILQAVVPERDVYTPVYAYWRRSVGRSVRCWYYAIGLTVDKMYIVPLTIEGSEIGYGDTMVIRKEDLSQIDSGKPGGTMHTIKFMDKNQQNIFEVIVEESNTKLDKTYPVNITQVEETRVFMKNIEQWSKEIFVL